MSALDSVERVASALAHWRSVAKEAALEAEQLRAENTRLRAVVGAASELRAAASGYEDASKVYVPDDSFLGARRRYQAAKAKLYAALDAWEGGRG